MALHIPISNTWKFGKSTHHDMRKRTRASRQWANCTIAKKIKNRNGKIFHHNIKNHPKVGEIEKFDCKMFQNV